MGVSQIELVVGTCLPVYLVSGAIVSPDVAVRVFAQRQVRVAPLNSKNAPFEREMKAIFLFRNQEFRIATYHS